VITWKPAGEGKRERFAHGAKVVLELSQIREQPRPLLRVHESAIHRHAIGRHKGRQVALRDEGRRIDSFRAPEQRIVVIEYVLERRSGIVVEIRRGPADPPQLRDVHHAEIRWMACEKQSPGIRGRDELEITVRERDAIPARVAGEPRWTGREAIRRRPRTRRLNVVIAHEWPRDQCLGSAAAWMQCPTMTLRARAIEYGFALLLEFRQLRIRIG